MTLSRRTPLRRTPFTVPFNPDGTPAWSSLTRRQGLQGTRHLSVVAPVVPIGTGRQRKPLSPVSSKRRAQNRERAAMADRRWPDRREGTVMCAVWEVLHPDWCEKRASDLHEIVRRSQLGSIVSEENTIPTCRTCNGLLSDGPDWGYRHGFIRHDALCCQGRKVCVRYEDSGDVA